MQNGHIKYRIQERLMYYILEELHIPFIKQGKITQLPSISKSLLKIYEGIPLLYKHPFDAILTKHNIILELDGCYWHNCPICGNNSTSHKIKFNVIKDNFLTTCLYSFHIKLVRIYEHNLIHPYTALEYIYNNIPELFTYELEEETKRKISNTVLYKMTHPDEIEYTFDLESLCNGTINPIKDIKISTTLTGMKGYKYRDTKELHEEDEQIIKNKKIIEEKCKNYSSINMKDKYDKMIEEACKNIIQKPKILQPKYNNMIKNQTKNYKIPPPKITKSPYFNKTISGTKLYPTQILPTPKFKYINIPESPPHQPMPIDCYLLNPVTCPVPTLQEKLYPQQKLKLEGYTMKADDLDKDVVRFYAYLSGRKSGQTTRAYKSSFNMFITYLRDNNLELSEKSINDWLIELKEDGDSNRTLNRHLFALKSYLKFSRNLDIINNIESYVTDIQEQIAIPVIQLKKLLDYCFGPFETLLITILISTGARIGEIALLKKEDVKEHEGSFILKMVTVKKRKGNVTRTVPIKSDWAIDNIKNCINELEKEKLIDLVFLGKSPDSLRYLVKEIGRRAGMPFIHPHTFRHTYITEMYRKGVNIKQIQKLVGHSSITITEGYIHTDAKEIFDNTPEI